MSSSKEETLSPEELRKRLYQTFKSKGVLDTLKAQLRNQLIHELKYTSLGEGSVPCSVPANSEPVVSACNSIMADHLRASGYEYTLSVFSPESGLCKDKVFSKEDLFHILQISPSSPLCSFLSDMKNNNKGFLYNLLTQLAHYQPQSQAQDVDTQTMSWPNYGQSLVEKMKMIDEEYESFNPKEDKMYSFQSKLNAYRNETKAQLETEMKIQLQHFKEVEIAKVRTEEKSKFHREIDKLKQELERNYEMKAKALIEREKNAHQMLQKQQEIEEKNVYMQRQSVLKEIATLRNRENELKIRLEAFEKTCQIHTEKVKTDEEILRRREMIVKTMEDTYDQKLKNELNRYQFELKEEYIKRTEDLTESENRNKAEAARIQKEAAVIEAQLDDNNRIRSELKHFQVELDTAQQQISLLTQQKELFRERLESTIDYPLIKSQNSEMQGQLQLLQKQLEEAQEENRRLRAEMIKPSKEQLALQAELQRLQDAHRRDEEEFDIQKQVLKAQLQNEVELCAQLKAQLLDSEERSQLMIKHVEDIKIQLCQTHQALENEVLRNPKPSLVDRSILELSSDKLVLPDIYVDRPLLRVRGGNVNVCEAGEAPRRKLASWKDSQDSDMELVAEAKARIQELQREAETLEEAYRNYQQRAVHSTISHFLPPEQIPPPPDYPPLYTNSSLRKIDSHHSHVHLIHKLQTPFPAISPQRIRSPILVSHDTRNISTHAQQNVTFSDELPPGKIFTDDRNKLETDSLFLRDSQLQDQNFTSTHTSRIPSRKSHHRETLEEKVVSPEIFPQLPSDRRSSGGLIGAGANTDEFSPELSPPHSPQLKSTAREQTSPPKLEVVFSSSESSPQPEKINLDDLTETPPEPGHIPQLLLDTAVPLSEEAPHHRDLPEDPTDSQGQPDVPESLIESAKVEEEDDEEQKWEKERKERQERRQKELEEAKERERQELERLEEETVSQEVQQPEQKEETEVKKVEDEEKKDEVENEEEVNNSNPLEKYMKMVLEAREKQPVQSPIKKEGETSLEDKSLSEEKVESIAAYVPNEEDDDFW